MIIIEVIAPATHEDSIIRLAKQNNARDHWISSRSDKQIALKVLVEKVRSQKLLDQLQTLMEGKSNFRVLAYPLTIALPYDKASGNNTSTLSREALLSELKTQGKLDGHFLMLVFLSTIVAAIGLIENNVAVIIGAMVIAPLLGPNLALSLSTTLGQVNGIINAARTLVVGVGFALLLSVLLSFVYPHIQLTPELLSPHSCGHGSLSAGAGFRCGGGAVDHHRGVIGTGGSDGRGGIITANRDLRYLPGDWRPATSGRGSVIIIGKHRVGEPDRSGHHALKRH